jgi:hypothetical protein
MINMPQTVGRIAVADKYDGGVVVNAQAVCVKCDSIAGVTENTNGE